MAASRGFGESFLPIVRQTTCKIQMILMKGFTYKLRSFGDSVDPAQPLLTSQFCFCCGNSLSADKKVRKSIGGYPFCPSNGLLSNKQDPIVKQEVSLQVTMGYNPYPNVTRDRQRQPTALFEI